MPYQEAWLAMQAANCGGLTKIDRPKSLLNHTGTDHIKAKVGSLDYLYVRLVMGFCMHRLLCFSFSASLFDASVRSDRQGA